MRLTVGTRAERTKSAPASAPAAWARCIARAYDTRLKRDVAVAVVSAPVAANSDSRARLERETRTLASLDHPCIGAIYAFEHVSPGGTRPGLAMLVERETLADRIRRGPIPAADALEMAVRSPGHWRSRTSAGSSIAICGRPTSNPP